MNSEEDVEDKTEEQSEEVPKNGFFERLFASLESSNPKLADLLKNLRVQAFILFIFLLIFYLNLIIWDF
jgi:hypothetical protein